MRWFDTGVNLLDPRFDILQVLDESKLAGVSDILVISSDIEESFAARDLCRKINTEQSTQASPIFLHQTAGVHPHYAEQADPVTWAKLEQILADNTISAVGECGLDFNRNYSSPQAQLKAFDVQLQLAKSLNKGVYLHEREAFEKQHGMLKHVSSSLPFKVAHCFTGTVEQLKAYLALDCYIGITGWVCDDKRGQTLQDAVKVLPLERILLETDAPYLFPKTLRPRQRDNAPKYLSAIAQKVAELKGISVGEVALAAYENACSLFK
uniref:TatD family hydrolase n=1 Tax=Ningiella ruwaisensis TaxID=2364274 RepID=UPI00109F945A|nr:TatD family hydrolase [Ningiella ruwaisensis]